MHSGILWPAKGTVVWRRHIVDMQTSHSPAPEVGHRGAGGEQVNSRGWDQGTGRVGNLLRAASDQSMAVPIAIWGSVSGLPQGKFISLSVSCSPPLAVHPWPPAWRMWLCDCWAGVDKGTSNKGRNAPLLLGELEIAGLNRRSGGHGTEERRMSQLSSWHIVTDWIKKRGTHFCPTGLLTFFQAG